MPFQVSPGVNISERDLTTVVPNVATSIGAFSGAFQWGPVLERVRLSTENELVQTFGEPDDETFEYFWSAANYLAYANNLLVVRNVGTAARNATIGASGSADAIKIDNVDDYNGSASEIAGATNEALFIAKYPGLLGNSLSAYMLDADGWGADFSGAGDEALLAIQNKFKASFDRAPGTSTNVGDSGGSNDELHVLIEDTNGLFTGTAGEALEAHAFVSKARDAKKTDGSSNYVKDVLQNESIYVWLGLETEITATSADTSATNAGQLKGVNTTFKRINSTTKAQKILGGQLAGAVSGSVGGVAITPGQQQEGYNLFADAETVDITLLIAGPTDQESAQYCVNLAETRKDCVAFVSPIKGTVVNTVVSAATASAAATAIVAEKNAIGSSSYGVMDNAWKYQYDRYRDLFVNVPMNGDIAGLCARTDFTNDAWFSPAGLTRGTIKNIVRPSWDASQANRDELYKGGVNPITTQLGAGNILFGDKTMLAVPSAFDRINVRRLFIVLEKAIAIAAKAMLFEFNDEFTRSQFVNIVTPFLREVQGRRGLTDFKVVCDSSNNTGQVIDTNNFVGDIYIKPNRSINFIQLNFIAARSDVSFSEIGG